MAEKTSLERSHSKSSNAKLTLLCLLSSTSLMLAVATIGLVEKVGSLMLIICALCSVIFILTVSLFGKFTR